MIRLLLFLGFGVLLYFFFLWLFRQPPKFYWRWLGVLAAVTLLVLVATGRAHWLTAVFAAILPFLRVILSMLGNLPLLKRLFSGVTAAGSSTAPGDGHASTVQGRYVRMTLNHESGDIQGEVLEGRFRGRTLDQLQLDDLLQLLQECQDDGESVALLQAYLDRVHPDTWQERAREQGQQRASSAPGDMSREEALQVLGLSAEASEEEIVQAHRRLMKNLHPDRGGSAYLAAKINQARETLLAG